MPNTSLHPDAFVIGEHRYRLTGKLNAIQQLHVVRRLAPLASAFAGADLAALRPDEQKADPERAKAAMQSLITPLTEAIAKVSDSDTEYVLGACMGVVEREMAGGAGWGPTWSVPAKAMMYSDIMFIDMMTIVGRVLMANVGDFGSALSRTGAKPAAVLSAG